MQHSQQGKLGCNSRIWQHLPCILGAFPLAWWDRVKTKGAKQGRRQARNLQSIHTPNDASHVALLTNCSCCVNLERKVLGSVSLRKLELLSLRKGWQRTSGSQSLCCKLEIELSSPPFQCNTTLNLLSGPEKGATMKGVFSLEESLEFIKSLTSLQSPEKIVGFSLLFHTQGTV